MEGLGSWEGLGAGDMKMMPWVGRGDVLEGLVPSPEWVGTAPQGSPGSTSPSARPALQQGARGAPLQGLLGIEALLPQGSLAWLSVSPRSRPSLASLRCVPGPPLQGTLPSIGVRGQRSHRECSR